MKLQPLSDHIIIEPLKQEIKTKGIVLPIRWRKKSHRREGDRGGAGENT